MSEVLSEYRVRKAGNLSLAVLEVHDGSHTMRVGKGSADQAASVARQWEAEGWHTILTVGGTGRLVAFRQPFVPVRCDRCQWAGLNLGIHYKRAHGGLTPPGGPLVAERVRAQTRAARARVDLNRRPRRGMLVVKHTSDKMANVWRLDRVDLKAGEVDVVRLAPHPKPAMRTFTITIEALLKEYRPVGTWSRS